MYLKLRIQPATLDNSTHYLTEGFIGPQDSRNSSSCSAQPGAISNRVSPVDRHLARRVDLVSAEVRHLAHRVFLITFNLRWAAFGQQQPQQQPVANPMFGGFGTNPTTAQTTGKWTRVACINRLKAHPRFIRRSIWTDSLKHCELVLRAKSRGWYRSVWFYWIWIYNWLYHHEYVWPTQYKYRGSFW